MCLLCVCVHMFTATGQDVGGTGLTEGTSEQKQDCELPWPLRASGSRKTNKAEGLRFPRDTGARAADVGRWGPVGVAVGGAGATVWELSALLSPMGAPGVSSIGRTWSYV